LRNRNGRGVELKPGRGDVDVLDVLDVNHHSSRRRAGRRCAERQQKHDHVSFHLRRLPFTIRPGDVPGGVEADIETVRGTAHAEIMGVHADPNWVTRPDIPRRVLQWRRNGRPRALDLARKPAARPRQASGRRDGGVLLCRTNA
jgi:hypothetical protein